MEELTASLNNSFQFTKSENSIYAPHPRQTWYKKKSGLNQDKRRERYLELQKQKRVDYQAHARKLAMDEWSDEEEDDTEEEYEDKIEMDVTDHIKPPRRYKDQLMLSEWLVDVPPDFETNWLMKLCPLGRRNLVVAAKGRTHNYAKSGCRMGSFASALPGGNRASATGYTLLDCIYSEIDKTFYILDVMCWNKHPVYDCDTEFRFFWLQSKLEELGKEASGEPYKFKMLSHCACDKESMAEELKIGLSDLTDGVLFYHKRSYYTFGATPLVLWLKPNMLPEMLGVCLPRAMPSHME